MTDMESRMASDPIKLGHDLPDDGGGISGMMASNVETCNANGSNGSIKEKIKKTADIKIDERGADFESFLLKESILKGLKRANYNRPSPIQLKAIPVGRLGLDLVVQAKSGTGKTCVFTVLALEAVEPSNSATQVLIVAPAREIALQINETLTAIGHFLVEKKRNEFTGVQERKDGIRIECFIGGTTLQVDKDKSRLQKCQIVVGTPGRIRQLINEGDLSLEAIRLFVLDEADKLMEDSYKDDINNIYAHLPKGKQLVVTSATYPRQLDEFLSRYMRTPQFVKLDAADVQLLGVKQYLLVTEKQKRTEVVAQEKAEFESWLDRKIDLVNHLLSRVLFSQCLIFCNYQDKAEAVFQKLLTAYKWPAAMISSNLSQSQRTSVLRRLKNVQIRILVSSDVMARGIDAENVDLVINFEVPWDAETYFHRIGRAGRFGGYGAAVTFVTNYTEEHRFYSMAVENAFHVKVLASIDVAPNNLVENEQFFKDLPSLDIPDMETRKNVAAKRNEILKQKRRDGQSSGKVSSLPEGLDEYTNVMNKAGPVERWSPTEFVWESQKDSRVAPLGKQNHELRQYSRTQMLVILKDSFSSLPSSRGSVTMMHSGERDPSPSSSSTAFHHPQGQRIDVYALFSRVKMEEASGAKAAGTSTSEKEEISAAKKEEASTAKRKEINYFCLPTKLPREEQEQDQYLFYVDDFISGGVTSGLVEPAHVPTVDASEPVVKNGSIRAYRRDELLNIRPFCVKAYAETVFNFRNLLATFEKKKTKKKRPQNEAANASLKTTDNAAAVRKDTMDQLLKDGDKMVDKKVVQQPAKITSIQSSDTRKSIQPLEMGARSQSSGMKEAIEPVEKAMTIQPVVDIRRDYDQAITDALQSPFYRFFGDCTLQLQHSAVKGRKSDGLVLEKDKAGESMDKAMQTEDESMGKAVQTENDSMDKAKQTEHCKIIPIGRVTVSYNHEEMLIIWRQVATPDWSHQNRHYPWIDTVKEKGLLVDRYTEVVAAQEDEKESGDVFPEAQKDVENEEYVQSDGTTVEEDDDLEEELESVISEYRATLKEHKKVLSEYQKIFRAYYMV